MYWFKPFIGSATCLFCFLRKPILIVFATLAVAGLLITQEAAPPECLPDAIVTFAFDDGYESVFTRAYPILKEYSYPATVFAIADKVGERGYMSTEMLNILYRDYWEIGSHSVTHPDLTLLAESAVRFELSTSKEFFEERGFSVTSFAVPFGEHNEKVLSLIAEYYDFHRTAYPDGLNDIPLAEENRYLLKTVMVKADTTVQEVKDWVLRAKEENSWLILTFHRIDESGEYSWTSEDFREIVSFVNLNGFLPVTLCTNMN